MTGIRGRHVAAAVAVTAVVSLTLAGCGSSAKTTGGGGGTSPTASAGAGLGTPDAASGSPVVFGVLNLQDGPVTFPQTLLAEQAAVDYVNAYKGGIGGHPIKLVTCSTDGQPSTSASCANQVLASHPVAILGAADTGAPGAIPVYARADLAYLGGIPFTPVESNYANAAIFSDVSTADNAALSVYAAKTLNLTSAAIIYTSDTQGTAGEVVVDTTMKNAGITKITKIGIPPTSSDVSSAVATAVGAHPGVVYVDAPGACPNILASLKQLGNTSVLMGIDPCTSPKAIAGANGGANGLYFATPVVDPHSGTAQANLYLAALAKYAPPSIALDSTATIGFQTVINVQAALASFTTADLTTAKILAAFKDKTDVPNFMGHAYTCDGKQIAGASAVCDAYEQIRQIKGTSITVANDFVTPGSYYTP